MKEFLIGSSLLGLTKIKDIDYLIISEDESGTGVKDGVDFRYRTLDNLKETLAFKNEDNRKLFNYQLDQAINKEFGEFMPYHLLDYRKELILFLKEIASNKKFNFNKRITTNNGHCTKYIYHIAYNLFIVENNSPIITTEQKEIVQKIHDLKMPIDYLDELDRKINEL